MFKIDSKLSFRDRLDAIARHLSQGDRMDAGWSATVLAKGRNDPKELRAIVQVLADALIEIGESHKKRGRPKRAKLSTRGSDGSIAVTTSEIHEHPKKTEMRIRETSLFLLTVVHHFLLVARDVRDGRNVSATNLAWLMWHYGATCADGCEGKSLSAIIEETALAIEADRSGALAIIRPLAKRELKDHGLLTAPRKGFSPLARRRLAEKHHFTVDQLRRAH